MASKYKKQEIGAEHIAKARCLNLPISTKQSVELSRSLRYKKTGWAKQYLEDIIALKKAVPSYRYTKDLGHKAGMSAGRFPQKAAKEFLQMVKSVEANAQFKGLNVNNLKITKIVANRAAIPQTGGRMRYATKRTHLEIEVEERINKEAKKEGKSQNQTKTKPKKSVTGEKA